MKTTATQCISFQILFILFILRTFWQLNAGCQFCDSICLDWVGDVVCSKHCKLCTIFTLCITTHYISVPGPSFRILDWTCQHGIDVYRVNKLLYRRVTGWNWFSLWCLMPWINHHLPHVNLSFRNQDLNNIMFGIMERVFIIFAFLIHMCLKIS